MADTILGLPTSAKFAAESDRFYNHRRKILHSYPNGKSPLTGILSMCPEEETNDSIMIWNEKRYISPQTTLRGTARVTSTAPSTGDADDGTNIVTGATTLTTTSYFKVASTKDFKKGHVFRVDTDGNLWWVIDVVRGVADASLLGYIVARPIRAVTLGVIATIFASGTTIRIVGSAYGEGASAGNHAPTGFKRPFPIQNTTQIFTDVFDFPRSVLQMGLKYDKSGPYKEKAHDTMTDHMTSIERSLLFGKRATTTRASFDNTQEDLTVRTFSGIIEFLELWDAGSTGIAVDGATYAPYLFKGPSTVDTDDQKRVIANAGGTISVDSFTMYAERAGRYHTNKSDEKLVLLGSGALIALTKMFRMNSVFNVEEGAKVYGLTVTRIVTPFGTFNLVSHPLFNEDPTMRYWMLFLDIWSIKFRPLTNSDTRIQKMVQNRGDDFRRDKILTEAGVEFWFPEQHLLLKNVQNYIES